MSMDAINVIREAEKAAEAAERKAKEQAAEIISGAHADAKEFVASKVAAAKSEADSSLASTMSGNEAFIKKAEAEILEEVSRLRSQAESKKKLAADEVMKMLF